MKYRMKNSSKTTMKKSYNTYSEYVDSYVEGSVFNENATATTTVTEENLTKWFSDPEEYLEDIVSYMTYMFISNGFINQLYTLYKTLPKLNYKIKVFDDSVQGYKENVILCDKALNKVRYKTLSRDIIGQLCLTGTVISVWLGNKKDPYLYVFSDNNYIFAPYRRNGEWLAYIDLEWINNMEEKERLIMYETFKDIKLQSAFEKYSSSGDEELKYLELPQERTSVIKLNTILRNQRVGLPLGIQSLADISHKSELRKLEQNIISKIIKSIAVLTIGDKDHEYEDIGEGMKRQIISSVKSAVSSAENVKKIPTTILPSYANIQFPTPSGTDIFSDGADKFEEVNNSIRFALGLSEQGSNYQSSKLNLEITHSKIDIILEDMQQIFQKLFYLVLPRKTAENFAFEFITGVPLSLKEELDIYTKLHAEGMSYKNIIDMLPSSSYFEMIGDAVRESEELDFKEKLQPPKTSSTLSAEDSESSAGRPKEEDPVNENTIASQETGGAGIDGSTE